MDELLFLTTTIIVFKCLSENYSSVFFNFLLNHGIILFLLFRRLAVFLRFFTGFFSLKIN